MLDYPVTFTPDDNDTIMVTFDDVPEAVSFGDTEDEARLNAIDALETALSAYITDRREIPRPSAAAGRVTVQPSLSATLKLAIYNAMRAREWRKADLARAMHVNPRQVDRLLDLRHASTVAQFDAALALCGQRAVIETEDLVS